MDEAQDRRVSMCSKNNLNGTLNNAVPPQLVGGGPNILVLSGPKKEGSVLNATLFLVPYQAAIYSAKAEDRSAPDPEAPEARSSYISDF